MPEGVVFSNSEIGAAVGDVSSAAHEVTDHEKK